MDLEFKIVSNDNEINIVSEVAKKIWNEYYFELLGVEQINYMIDKFQSKEVIKNQINDGMIYKTIIFENKICGYYAIKIEYKKIFISKIYIYKQFRGKKISKAVIEDILINSHNIKNLYLTVNKRNIPSIKAYEKMGFKKIDAVKSDIGSGYFMDDYIMEKYI